MVPCELDQRILTLLQKALREGLRQKILVDTQLFEVDGSGVRPIVVTQVTREWLETCHGFSEIRVDQVEIWLKKFGLTFKPTDTAPSSTPLAELGRQPD